jgi:hypothetical protein
MVWLIQYYEKMTGKSMLNKREAGGRKLMERGGRDSMVAWRHGYHGLFIESPEGMKLL